MQGTVFAAISGRWRSYIPVKARYPWRIFLIRRAQARPGVFGVPKGRQSLSRRHFGNEAARFPLLSRARAEGVLFSR